MLVWRADHELNTIKAEKLTQIAAPIEVLDSDKLMGCHGSFIGPVNASMRVIVDRSAAVLADFACGANKRNSG